MRDTRCSVQDRPSSGDQCAALGIPAKERTCAAPIPDPIFAPIPDPEKDITFPILVPASIAAAAVLGFLLGYVFLPWGAR